jgi:MtfA peptidase
VLEVFKRLRRPAIRERPFPPAWGAIIEKNVAYYRRLPPEDQEELRGHVQVFLEEKSFVGCNGLELTDEIRVTVAAQACVLLLHRETDYFPDLESILVYPSTYVAHRREQVAGGVVIEGPEARLGESWLRGEVVLAWDSVLAGAADARDGHNVVFHEFAHQLDQETGEADGAPALPRRSMYIAWARVLGAEFEELVRQAEQRHRTDIDRYGATNPAEFFAVVTEAFFEKPQQLRRKHPALYEQLQLFYRQDPAARSEAAPSPD